MSLEDLEPFGLEWQLEQVERAGGGDFGPYNAFAVADQESHYLWQAGFRSYCDCSRCEAECEARYEEWQALYDAYGESATPLADMVASYLDGLAREAAAEAEAARLAAEGDPWNPPF